MATLTGPSQPPASGGPPRQLVMLLHGYGADGADLLGLAPFFAGSLPHAEFVAPNAPEPCEMGFGYQWFGLGGSLDPARMLAGIRKAGPILDAYIDEALAARNLAPRQLALIGFSQGTMMAIDRAMRREASAAAIVGFSGMVADPSLRLPENAVRPPILLVHGTADPVVPFAQLAAAEAALTENGYKVETMTRPGLGHGIDPEGAHHAAVFLAHNLAAASAP